MALLSLSILAILAYLLALYGYRLYLSPLAKIPGPKLAAISRWYEAYYDMILGGKFRRHFGELHDRYGPIVRIGPEEVHIKDSSFYDEVFVRRPKADKPPSLGQRFANAGSGFATVDAAHHRALRAPLNPFFSRRSLLEQQAQIQAKAESLIQGIRQAKGPLNLTDAYSALACDVVYDIAFGFTYNQVESEAFKQNLNEAFTALLQFGHIAVQFPWINTLMENLPNSWIQKVPLLAMTDGLKQDFLRTVRQHKKALAEKTTDGDGKNNMFRAILQSDLPPSDKEDLRLAQEAQVIIGGGILSSAWGLCAATYHILSNDDILSKLREELREAVPDISHPEAFKYEKLERLPYLTGCVKEAIRISEPISGRLSRVFPEPLVYKDWEIPPQTTVAMNIRDVNFDASIFTEPEKFKPERWAPGANKLEDGTTLEDHFVGFSKGPRMCLGMPLAYMEAYITLAHVFRRLELQLYETTASDIEVDNDCFVPVARAESKGVRVLVVGDLK